MSSFLAQHDWFPLRPSSTFWISESSSSVQTQHDVSIGPDLSLSCPTLSRISIRGRVLSVDSENGSSRFVAPSETHEISFAPNDFDICGSKLLFAGANGSLLVKDKGEDILLPGAISDVLCARFFPSGEVILSGGMDMSLFVHSLEHQKCVATCKGHSGSILDCAIVERGRNVLSCGRDGSIFLFDVSRQRALHNWSANRVPVNCMDLCSEALPLPDPLPTSEPGKEFRTEGKELFCGLDDGKGLGLDLRAKDVVVEVDCKSSISCCSAEGSGSGAMVAFGTDSGHVYVYDTRHIGAPVSTFSRDTGAAVLALVMDGGRAWASTGDGCCTGWTAEDCIELSGPEFEPCSCLVARLGHGGVVTASKDRIVREYEPKSEKRE